MSFFQPANLIQRILLALFYGIIVFIVVVLIAAVLDAANLANVGAVLRRFGAIIAILAALLSFFAGARPTV